MNKLIAGITGVAAILGTSLLMPAAAYAEKLEIRWGASPGYKPFIFKKEDGTLTGFDYEIGAAICAELKAECTWVEQAWDGIIPGLLAKNYDAILSSMTITDERQKVISFTVKYYNAPNVFIAKDGTSLDDAAGKLAGVKIGTQAGTTHQKYLEAKFPEAEIKTYPSQDEVWLDMKSGRIDATLVSAPQAESWLKSDQGQGFALAGGEHGDQAFFGIGEGIGLRKEDDKLREKISEGIKAIRANGEYAKINARYFDIDIYGAE